MAFIDDIQSRDTALFPVVRFTDIYKYISTVSFSLESVPGYEALHYSPLLLSSPSVKESIDLENRKYKISNVSLKISNAEHNGLRFSDTQVPLNTNVQIWWVSPSCDSLYFDDTSWVQKSYLTFKGVVRAITHDEKTCNITLEDVSQSTLHRDVPVALLGTDESIPDKYKTKPIPMVYGDVENSPLVISNYSQTDGTSHIIADDVNNPARPDLSVSIIGDVYDWVNTLKVFTNDLYSTILKNSEHNDYWGYSQEASTQYTFEEGDGHIDFTADAGYTSRPITDNLAEAVLYLKPDRYKSFSSGDNYILPAMNSPFGQEWNRFNPGEINDTTWTGRAWGEETTPDGELSLSQMDHHRIIANFSPSAHQAEFSEFYIKFEQNYNVSLTDIQHSENVSGSSFDIIVGTNNPLANQYVLQHGTTSDYINPNKTATLHLGWHETMPGELVIHNYWSYPGNEVLPLDYVVPPDGSAYGGNLTFGINSLYLVVNYLIKDFTTSDFHANVQGRTSS